MSPGEQALAGATKLPMSALCWLSQVCTVLCLLQANQQWSPVVATISKTTRSGWNSQESVLHTLFFVSLSASSTCT